VTLAQRRAPATYGVLFASILLRAAYLYVAPYSFPSRYEAFLCYLALPATRWRQISPAPSQTGVQSFAMLFGSATIVAAHPLSIARASGLWRF
jgi:hypothetical protein